MYLTKKYPDLFKPLLRKWGVTSQELVTPGASVGSYGTGGNDLEVTYRINLGSNARTGFSRSSELFTPDK